MLDLGTKLIIFYGALTLVAVALRAHIGEEETISVKKRNMRSITSYAFLVLIIVAFNSCGAS